MSVDSSSWKNQEWAKINVKSTRDVYFTSIKKKASLTSEKKCKKSRASRISSCTKREKNSVKCHALDSNLRPLVYEASVLPTELSFRIKNWEKIMTIYISFVVQYTLSHIVEHRKLDSLATPDNTVWSTMTSCWTNNVRQFGTSLWYSYATIKLVSPDKIFLLRDKCWLNWSFIMSGDIVWKFLWCDVTSLLIYLILKR